MRPSPWPPDVVLGAVVVAGAALAVVSLVLGWPPEAVALPLAAALGTTAVLVDRWTPRAGRAAAADPRRPAPRESRQVREVVERRPLLLRATLAVAGIAGLGAVGWLWRFAPRRPAGTGWQDGVRAVDADGRPVLAVDLPPGGVVTVWPEGRRDEELAAVVVLRLLAPAGDPPADGTAILAYSRICTHAGCPVALFRAEDSTLYCPCHQATFDARRDAHPVAGPASRPLPRLPVGTDAEGFLVARGDLSGHPGPRMGGRA